MGRYFLAFVAAALIAVPLASAQTPRDGGTVPTALPGDLLVTFSGSGGGGYRFREPAAPGPGCRTPDTTYSATDTYDWSFSFVVPAGGGGSAAPVFENGSGQIAATEATGRCRQRSPSLGACTQALAVPQADGASTDAAYPGVNVVASGRLITVGAIGELVPGTATCGGGASLFDAPLAGYRGLQASVSFPRAKLRLTGDVRVPFTMAGSGLYDGFALSGSCDSLACDPATCQESLQPGGAGAPTSCSYDESYSGTIEIRILH